MDLGLTNKRALVLGSTRGIGRGIAEVLAREGASVAICGRNAEDARKVAEEISGDTGAIARSYGVDLTDQASVATLIDACKKDFNGFDIVINNGGGPPPGGVADVAMEVWEAQYRPLFLSQVQVTNAFLPGMRERGWGRILVTASSGTVQPIPHLGISNTLRVALTNWAKTLAGEVAADGVTVNSILPGRIHTARVDSIDVNASNTQNKDIEQIRAESRATIPANRYGTVDEFAKVAVFLVSDCASYVTGTVTRVDGGFIKGVDG
ncbi:MAG: SDR family oxidoreductase [Proteobacteria bacterium]|nr:SDR family oxidoreductase [Pseudomonadota bacterium]MDA1326992.1 SDR family oxidoreductase [Pseudomonadota bacterium]